MGFRLLDKKLQLLNLLQAFYLVDVILGRCAWQMIVLSGMIFRQLYDGIFSSHIKTPGIKLLLQKRQQLMRYTRTPITLKSSTLLTNTGNPPKSDESEFDPEPPESEPIMSSSSAASPDPSALEQ